MKGIAVRNFEGFSLFDVHNALYFDSTMNSNNALEIYELLETDKQSILLKLKEFTPEDLWYSQYYWFLIIMQERNAWGLADYEQQKFRILDNMDQYIQIDWNIIEKLEQAVQN